MSRAPVLERGPRLVEPRRRVDNEHHEPRTLLTEREAMERARYFDRGCANPVRAFQRWATRVGIPVKWIARRRHYDPRVLDAFLDNATWTKRHRQIRTSASA